MPLTVDSVSKEIDAFAPREGAAGWDPVGLQIGDAAASVESIAVCHEVTESVVAALELAPVDLIVTYHPLLFEATRSLTVAPTPAGRAYRLSRLGASLIVVHTAFDSAPGGTADALAAAVGMDQPSGFFPAWRSEALKVVTFVPTSHLEAVADAMSGAGAGNIGNYTGCSFRIEGVGTFVPGTGAEPFSGERGEMNAQAEVRIEMIADAHRRDAVVEALVAAHPYESPAFDVFAVESASAMIGRVGTLGSAIAFRALAAAVADTLDTTVRGAGTAKDVQRVAVLPGSGGSAIAAAVEAGAEVLITGDVRHHEARRALDLGLSVIDAGHAATERPGVRALYDLVSGIGPDTVDLTFIDPNPWEEAWRS